MTEELKIGRIVTFSGKRAEWLLWSEKFLARENCNGYKSMLVGTDIVPDDDEDIVVERFPLDEAWNMVKSGDIQDVKTIAILSMSGEITNS